jgi:WD40 repeat protein
VWDTAGGQEVHRLDGLKGMVPGVAFSPDGTRLACAVTAEDVVQVWDLAAARPCIGPLAANQPTGVTYSPDGRRLAANGLDGLVRLWDAETGSTVLTLRGFGPPASGRNGFSARVAFSPDGMRLAANGWEGTVTVWEAGRPEEEPSP